MKKIAVIGLKGLPAFGGAAAVGESLINKLKNEYNFTVLSTASHTSADVELGNIKQVVFKNFGKGGLNTLIYYIRSLVHVLFHSYDLIHLHHAESGFITPFLRMKYKVIVTFHGVFMNIDPKFSKFQNKFFRFSEKLNVKYANQVISVSGPDCDYIYNKYKRTIDNIPNGIDILDLNSSKNKEGISFAAGRIYDIKGLHLLLDALRDNDYQGNLYIAGDLNQVGTYRDKILKQTKSLNVEFKGLIKNKVNLLDYIQGTEFFVFPSLTEAMSMMLLEVVSTKTPIIASNIPSVKAIFSDDEVLFFENNNSSDLAEKVLFAQNNKDLMKKKAEKAFEKIEKNYTWDLVAKQYNNEYKKLLNP